MMTGDTTGFALDIVIFVAIAIIFFRPKRIS